MIDKDHQTNRPQRFSFWAALFFCLGISAFTLFTPQVSDAQTGFAGGVSPSRFDIVADPGDVVKRSIQIYNLADRPHEFSVETNEWAYSADGVSSFSDNLAANSCRPWVKLQRRQIKILPSATRARNFRFEIHVPENAQPRECRFALLLSSNAEPYNTSMAGGQISLPTTGKVGVIVYLRIGNVAPQLSVQRYLVTQSGNAPQAAIQVHNAGTAHGRLDSELSAIDAKGKKFTMQVASTPVLPGQTRLLALTPDQAFRDAGLSIHYPLNLEGRLLTDTSSIPVNTILYQ